MIWVVVVCVVILGIGAVAALVRLATARDDASVAAVSDLSYFSAIAIFLMIGMAFESSVLLDVAAIASMIGILATVSLARILTRGRR